MARLHMARTGPLCTGPDPTDVYTPRNLAPFHLYPDKFVGQASRGQLANLTWLNPRSPRLSDTEPNMVAYGQYTMCHYLIGAATLSNAMCFT